MDATILFIYQIPLLSKFKEEESLYEFHIFMPYLLLYPIKYQPRKSLSTSRKPMRCTESY